MIDKTAGKFECAASMLANGVKEALTDSALCHFRRILSGALFE